MIEQVNRQSWYSDIISERVNPRNLRGLFFLLFLNPNYTLKFILNILCYTPL